MIVQLHMRNNNQKFFIRPEQNKTISIGANGVVCLQGEDKDGNVVMVTLQENDFEMIRDVEKTRAAVRALGSG